MVTVVLNQSRGRVGKSSLSHNNLVWMQVFCTADATVVLTAAFEAQKRVLWVADPSIFLCALWLFHDNTKAGAILPVQGMRLMSVGGSGPVGAESHPHP